MVKMASKHRNLISLIFILKKIVLQKLMFSYQNSITFLCKISRGQGFTSLYSRRWVFYRQLHANLKMQQHAFLQKDIPQIWSVKYFAWYLNSQFINFTKFNFYGNYLTLNSRFFPYKHSVSTSQGLGLPKALLGWRTENGKCRRGTCRSGRTLWSRMQSWLEFIKISACVIIDNLVSRVYLPLPPRALGSWGQWQWKRDPGNEVVLHHVANDD